MPSSSITPVRTLHVAKRLAGRATLAIFLRSLGTFLVFAAIVSLAAIALDKILAGRMSDLAPWVVWVAAPIGLAIIAAAIVALAKRPTLGAIAARADEAMGFKDRLSSALDSSHDAGNPIAAWVVAEGEEFASRVEASRVVPLKQRLSWLIGPALLAITIGVAIFVPARSRSLASAQGMAQLQRDAAAKEIKSIAATIAPQPTTREMPAARPEELRALEAIEQELTRGNIDPADARVAAARHVEQLADRLDADAQARAESLDRAREALSAASQSRERESASDRQSSEASREMLEALRRGDLQGAADAMRRLDQDSNAMPAGEREAVAQELESLAKNVDSRRSSSESADAKPGDRGAESRHSPDPSTSETTANREQDATTQPQDQPPSSPRASDPAKPPESAPSASPSDTLQRLSKALRDAAEQMRQPPAPSKEQSAPGKEQPKAQPAPQKDQTTPPQDQSLPRDQKNPASPSDSQPKPEAQPRNQSSESTNREAESSSQTQKVPQQPRTTNQESSRQPQPDARTPQEQAQDRPQSSQSQTEQSAQNQTSPSSQSDTQANQQEPSERRDQSGHAPTPDPSALGRIERLLREVANQPAQSQQQSQKLRDIARSLQENATPERREQLQRLAEQYAQREHGNENQQPQSQHGADPQNSQQSQYFPRGGESPDAKDNASDAGRAGNQTGGTPNPAAPSPSTARGTERTGIAPGSSTAGLRSGSPMGKASTPERDASDRTVDARSNAPVNPRERVIAEWYSNMPPDASARQSGSPAPTEELRRAAEAVDRAIEQQTIPPRYSDLVRRVFKRYAEQTAPPASREGTPPTTSKP